MDISFLGARPQDAPAIVVGIFADDLDGQLERLGQPESIRRAISAVRFKAKRDSFLLIPAPAGAVHECVLLHGLGSQTAISHLEWEKSGAALYEKLAELEIVDVVFQANALSAASAARLGGVDT